MSGIPALSTKPSTAEFTRLLSPPSTASVKLLMSGPRISPSPLDGGLSGLSRLSMLSAKKEFSGSDGFFADAAVADG